MTPEFRFIAGICIRKRIRHMLESEEFAGRKIRWMEQKGWIESTFRVRGEDTDVRAVQSRVEEYIKILNAA